MNAYSSSIRNLSKLEIIKCPLMDKQTVLYTYSGILLNSQKGNPVDTCDNTGESHRRAEQEAEHARMCAV